MCENYKNDTFKIRSLNISDYTSGYFELLQQIIGDETTLSQTQFEQFVQNLGENHVVAIIISVTRKKIVGTISIIVEPKLIHNGCNVAHFEDIIVHTDFRCCGIGKMLIDFAVDYSTFRGCNLIVADCSSHNTGFFSACGFIPNGTRMTQYIDPDIKSGYK